MTCDVCVISRQQRFPVTAPSTLSAPTVVPAESLTFELTGAYLPETVLLDGRLTRLVLDPERTRGHLFVDAFRSVGFHRLRVVEQEIFFATEDAKLRLDGILSLLRFLEHQGLSWGQQLFFSSGVAVRDPKIDFAWLAGHIDEIVGLAKRIADRPIRRAEHEETWGQPRGGKLRLPQTLAALRRNQRGLLEEHPAGTIHLQGRRYWPRSAVTLRRQLSADTAANRRVTRLLLDSLSLAGGVLLVDPPADARKQLHQVQARLADALGLFPFCQLIERAGRSGRRASAEEMADDRYTRTFALLEELTDGLGWEPGTTVADQFAYVAYSDQVYQAFVAVVLADAVGATGTHRSLRPNLPSPSFESADFAVYYDTVPPKNRFRNWRDESSRPSDMRPDVTVIDRARNRGILVDAKYRRDGARVDTRSLNECQVYMHSFGRRRIVVCYPGQSPAINAVTGDDNEILEVSIGPFAGLQQYVRESVWPAILARMEPNG